MTIATTYVLDFVTSDIEKIEDPICVNKLLRSIADLANFTIITNNFKKFSPLGLTSFFLLEESHLSMHTWPEFNFFCIDIFTCKQSIDIDKIIVIVQDAFDNTKVISKSALDRNLLL